MPKVNFVREEVTNLTPRWDLIRDCISGEKAIKDKGDKYLPRPNSADKSEENRMRYEDYKTRAVFYGVTGRTLKGFVGQVFARDSVVSIPDLMDPIKADANGAGVSLDQQARKALSGVMAFGRQFLLTDYPKTEGPASRADLLAGNIRPTISLFDAWDVVNWRTITIGSKKLLSLVVISEKEVVDDDGFEQKWDPFFRVLRLNQQGNYQTEIWWFDEKVNDFVMDGPPIIPLDSTGSPWREIPGTFIGSENNDETPDLPPLYDLAVLNIAHYRNSADYEESCHIVGQPTPYFAGLTEDWVKTVLKGTVQLGARGAVPLPEGGTAGLLQAEENTMPKEAMEHKEKQMVALGAKLVEQQSVQRTATEAGMEEASTTSVLATCANNVSHAYTAALKWAARFLGVEPATDTDISYQLNTDFDISRLPANEIAALIAAWQGNAITFEEMRDGLKRGGVAYLDDEEAKEQMEEAGIDLGMPVGSPASAAAKAAKEKAKADASAAKKKPAAKE